MIVPISSGGQGPTAMGDIPSETNLLMALATMHSMGRFTKDDAKKSLPKPKLNVGGEA